jgi:hypothetical protein
MTVIFKALMTKRYHAVYCSTQQFEGYFCTLETLQSHGIHTKFHWSNGPPVCFRHEGPEFNPQGVLT